jgi:heme A synthase
VSAGGLRKGEVLTGVGALGLFISLFLDWFGLDPSAFPGPFAQVVAAALAKDGWSSLGWFMVLILVVAILLGGWLVVAALRSDSVAQAVGAALLTASFGTLAFLVLAVRVVTQPDLGIGAPNAVVDVRAGAYLGLLFCALLALGGWLTLADERTDAPESQVTPPDARPVPPLTDI